MPIFHRFVGADAESLPLLSRNWLWGGVHHGIGDKFRFRRELMDPAPFFQTCGGAGTGENFAVETFDESKGLPAVDRIVRPKRVGDAGNGRQVKSGKGKHSHNALTHFFDLLNSTPLSAPLKARPVDPERRHCDQRLVLDDRHLGGDLGADLASSRFNQAGKSLIVDAKTVFSHGCAYCNFPDDEPYEFSRADGAMTLW
jgi:hypothetical protein